MLKGLLKKGGQIKNDDQVKMAEDKLKLVQEQLRQESQKVKEIQDLLDKTMEERTLLKSDRANSDTGTRQELQALTEKNKTLQIDLATAEESASVSK